MTAATAATPPTETGLSTKGFLWTAIAFGLATGLLEGVGLLIFHGYGWGNTRIPEGVSAAIVWISAVVNLALFSAVGMLFWALQRAFPRVAMPRAGCFVFAFLSFVDLLGVSGRVGPLAMIALGAGLAVVTGRRLTEHWDSVRRWSPAMAIVLGVVALLAFVGIQVNARSRETAVLKGVPSAVQGAPNVIVVVVDTLRADHLSLYGYNRPTSPGLDKLAAEAAVFDDAISASSWTLPAHQSLLSGRYPHEHGMIREQVVNQALPSLGKILGAKGYRTGAFSANTDFFCRRAGFAEGFQHFEDYFYSPGDMVYRTFWGRLVYRTYFAELLGFDELPARKKAADVNAEALHWVGQAPGKPFFAFLNYFDIHSPYVPEKSFRNRFVDGQRQAECQPSWSARLNPLHRPTEFERYMAMSPECFQVQVDQYDGGVAYVDHAIADLMAELRKDGLDRNTIVIITSDHGESFREHGLVTHGTSLYRELIHVPLLIWWPGHVPAGERISTPVSTASLPATVLDLIGAADEKNFPIPSLAKLWREPGAERTWPEPVSEMAQDLYIPQQYPAYKGWLKSITDSRWHLIVSESDPAELYDWPEDRQEMHNLAESAAGKGVAREINTRLWNQIGQTNPTRTTSASEPQARTQIAKAGQ